MATKSENAASLGELFARELGARELDQLRRQLERDSTVLGDITRLLLERDVRAVPVHTLGSPRREPLLDEQQARAALDVRTVAGWEPGGELLSSAQMAARIGLRGRQGVHHRFKQGLLIGFRARSARHALPRGPTG